MLESLEGRRGMIRAKPPLPAIAGLFGKPTVVNNVLSLATVPPILANGAEAFRELGVGRSRGTQVFQLAGNVKHGGIVEIAFGVTLGELVEDFGGGTATGRPVRAVQVGGPLGAYLPDEPVRPADGLRGLRGGGRDGRPRRHRGLRRHRRHELARRASRWSSAPRSPAASARLAESDPSEASRSSTASSPASTARPT